MIYLKHLFIYSQYPQLTQRLNLVIYIIFILLWFLS